MIRRTNRFQFEPPAEPPRSGEPRYRRDPAGLWADIPAFTAFASEVEEAFEAGQLRYPRRQRLLKRAERHYKLKRFDANLVIAMVQHRLALAKPIPPLNVPELPDRVSPFAILATFAAIQGMIVMAGWWLFR